MRRGDEDSRQRNMVGFGAAVSFHEQNRRAPAPAGLGAWGLLSKKTKRDVPYLSPLLASFRRQLAPMHTETHMAKLISLIILPSFYCNATSHHVVHVMTHKSSSSKNTLPRCYPSCGGLRMPDVKSLGCAFAPSLGHCRSSSSSPFERSN